MRCLSIAIFLVLVGCVHENTLVAQSDARPVDPLAPPVANAFARVERVASQILPVAQRFCREHNPTMPLSYCEFRLEVDRAIGPRPNAYQAIGNDGRPIIAVNPAMMLSLENDDEAAFLLAHEAGHQIASHVLKARLSAVSATKGFLPKSSLDPSSHGHYREFDPRIAELEADKLGALVARAAGFDPRRGANVLNRLSPFSDATLTHPGVGRRLEVIGRAIAQAM